MPVTVVVGGQYGSEGKGKIVAYLAKKDDVAAVVRCGGPNAGHSFVWQGATYSLRQVPRGNLRERINAPNFLESFLGFFVSLRQIWVVY